MKLPTPVPWKMLSSEDMLLCLQDGKLSPPPPEDFAFILQRFCKERNPIHVLHLHAYMMKNGLETDASSGNHLVSMLSKIGRLTEAQSIFDGLDLRDEMSWSSLITGYVKENIFQKALALYEEMDMNVPVCMSSVTLVALLKASAKLKDPEKGFKIHLVASKSGLLEIDPFVGTTLVDMYAKCGFLDEAQKVLYILRVRDVVSWTALISGYAEYGHGKKAIDCFEKMQLESISPNVVTYICLLKACTSIGDLTKGEEIHAEAHRNGMLERHSFLGSALVDMYAKCGSIALAQQMFDKILVRDTVSWTAMITGYYKHQSFDDTLQFLEQMLMEGVVPSVAIFVCSMKACGRIRATLKGQIIHILIESQGLLERDPVVGSTLVSMYAECDSLSKAEDVFDKLLVRDTVSWTALIEGYNEQGHVEEALNLFEQMHVEGIFPDASSFTCIIKSCIGNSNKGHMILVEIIEHGLLKENLSLCNTLVKIYLKHRLFSEAHQVFGKISVRDVILWSTLIAGYTEHGHGDEAIDGFRRMQCEGLCPNIVTFMHGLKASGCVGKRRKVCEIHSQIEVQGLIKEDHVIGNILIDVYTKCGLFDIARMTIDKMCVRNVVSWTTLMTGYVEHGYDECALNCFEEMQFEGHYPSAFTFTCVVKACGNIGATSKGQQMHADIERGGLLDTDLYVGDALMDMYLKCGFLPEAYQVFCRFPVWDVVSWNTLVAGCVEYDFCENVIEYLNQMQDEGISPNAFTYVCCLKACGKKGFIKSGQEMHTNIERKGLLEKDSFVGSALVDMYAKCGLLIEAQQVFDNLQVQDVVSWTTLISGYTEKGHSDQALRCFEDMQLEGFLPNSITFICSLKACGVVGDIDKGQKIHEEIERQELIKIENAIGSNVVAMYAKFGLLSLAEDVFERIPVQDGFAWGALIGGYVECGYNEEALEYFETMEQLKFILPTFSTLICCLKACGSIQATDSGQKIHAKIEKQGFLKKDIAIGNALLDMYVKCGCLAEADKLFDDLPDRDIISWNTLIVGYASHGHNKEAIIYFELMRSKGVCADVITLTFILKACHDIGATDKEQAIVAEIEEMGYLERDHYLGDSLINILVKKNSLLLAQQIFDILPVRDAVLWTSLIAGYTQHGYDEIALKYFEQMQHEGVSPIPATLVHCLRACSQIGAANKGREIHGEVERRGLSGRDLVGNTLIDMYAKCGSLTMAQQVFDQLLVTDVVSWTALMTGYAHLGVSQSVFDSFERMLGLGIKPDQVTFIVLLNACSRVGLFTKSQMYFESMTCLFGISPSLKHYSCVVDLLGRAGQMEKAITSAKTSPMCPNLVLWDALLSACRNSGCIENGNEVFERVMCLSQHDASADYIRHGDSKVVC